MRLFIRALVKKEVELTPQLIFNDLTASREGAVEIKNNGSRLLKNLTLISSEKFCKVNFIDKLSQLKPGETKIVKVIIDSKFKTKRTAYCKVQLLGIAGKQKFNLESVIKVKTLKKKK